VQETTEQVMSVHPILVSLPSDAKIGGWTWSLQLECNGTVAQLWFFGPSPV
jgi:hypothetical protein